MAIVARGYGRDVDVIGAIVASGFTILALVQDIPEGIIVRQVVDVLETRIAMEPAVRQATGSDALRTALIREAIRTAYVRLDIRQAAIPGPHTVPVVTETRIHTEDGHRIAVEPSVRITHD